MNAAPILQQVLIFSKDNAKQAATIYFDPAIKLVRLLRRLMKRGPVYQASAAEEIQVSLLLEKMQRSVLERVVLGEDAANATDDVGTLLAKTTSELEHLHTEASKALRETEDFVEEVSDISVRAEAEVEIIKMYSSMLTEVQQEFIDRLLLSDKLANPILIPNPTKWVVGNQYKSLSFAFDRAGRTLQRFRNDLAFVYHAKCDLQVSLLEFNNTLVWAQLVELRTRLEESKRRESTPPVQHDWRAKRLLNERLNE